MNFKHLIFGGMGNCAPLEYVQVKPVPCQAAEPNPKLDEAKAFLGSKWVLHPEAKPRDPRKLFKAKRKAKVRRMEKVKRKSVGGSKPRGGRK